MSNDILKSQLSILFSYHQKSFLLLETRTKTETPKWTMCRVGDLGTLSPKGLSVSIKPFPSVLGELCRRRERILLESERMQEPKETVSSRHNRTDAIGSHSMHRPAQVHIRWSPSTEKSGGWESPSLT